MGIGDMGRYVKMESSGGTGASHRAVADLELFPRVAGARAHLEKQKRPRITYASPPKPHRKSIKTRSLPHATKIPRYVYRPEDL
jgi:hypothetical protein